MFGGIKMEFLRNIGESVNSALDFVVEKNKKFNRINKIKKFIKKESNSIMKAYIKLGKHYYNELRDVPNYEMQNICTSIDNSKKEIKRLQEKLIEINSEDNVCDINELWEDEPVEVESVLDKDDNLTNLEDEQKKD